MTSTTALQAPPPLKHDILSEASTIIATVDAHAREINRRWGTNRLTHIVPLDLAERFQSQHAKYSKAAWECCGSLNPDDIARLRTQAEAMLRAYAALERAAVNSGRDDGPPTTWQFELKDGTPVVLVRDRHELGQVDLDGRAGQIWSLEEIADIVAKFPDIARTKECFPGTEVIQLRTPSRIHDKLNDELADLPGFA